MGRELGRGGPAHTHSLQTISANSQSGNLSLRHELTQQRFCLESSHDGLLGVIWSKKNFSSGNGTEGPGVIECASRYTDRMKQVLRRTSIKVGNVTYQSGDFSNNLHPSNITIEVLDDRVILSLDLSASQPRGSENSNSYLDAEVLREKFESLKFVQLDREAWLEKGLRSAVREAKEPATLELEIMFKDGSIRSMPATLEPYEHNFWIYRKA